MIHDAAEGLPSCYFKSLEKEIIARVEALVSEGHAAALGSDLTHCSVYELSVLWVLFFSRQSGHSTGDGCPAGPQLLFAPISLSPAGTSKVLYSSGGAQCHRVAVAAPLAPANTAAGRQVSVG